MTKPPKPARSYIATIIREQQIYATKTIKAPDRRKAVTRALYWFWYTFKGSLGQAHESLIVDDPYDEVHYGPQFWCSDRMNKLLPTGVIARLFVESKGLIIRDQQKGSKNHPSNSVRRKKRRRDFGRFIAPGIRQLNNGNIYFRITTQCQVTRNGRRIRKRKYRDILLDTKNPHDAVGEIQMRGLHRRSKCSKWRRSLQRTVDRLEIASHVLGLTILSSYKQLKYRRILRQYENPKPCKTCVP